MYHENQEGHSEDTIWMKTTDCDISEREQPAATWLFVCNILPDAFSYVPQAPEIQENYTSALCY